MAKTAMVLVPRVQFDSFYMTYNVQRKKYMVHDEEEMCKVGDTVRLVKTRPLSKRKHHAVVEVVHHAR